MHPTMQMHTTKLLWHFNRIGFDVFKQRLLKQACFWYNRDNLQQLNETELKRCGNNNLNTRKKYQVRTIHTPAMTQHSPSQNIHQVYIF